LEARLWSDRGQEQASGSLRQALTELRKALGPLADRLASDRDCVALAGFGTDLADTTAARRALAQGREFLEGIDIPDPGFNLWLADLPEGIEAAIARDLAAAVARLAAEYLLGEGQRGLSTDRLPGGFDLQLEGDWSEDRAYLKVRLVAKANQKTLWSQRLIASRVLDGRRELPQLVFETTEAQLM
ncbi:MAG: hypothetical protein WAT35_18460, partial [Tabrizicola sp.]